MASPIKDKRVLCREEKDGAVCYHPLKNNVLRLNETGWFVWNLCDGNNSIEDISDRLMEEFSVSKDIAVRDIKEFLKKLNDYDWLS